MSTPDAPGVAVTDPLPEAVGLAQSAAAAGLALKLLGGLAIRVLCPDFPPRLRAGQDMDFACLSKRRTKVAAFLEGHGCEPDRRFNGLNGDRQMYFTAPSGRPIDVMVDRLAMCHTLDFRPEFGRLPLTLDAADLLLSKLQIVELNEKDARDILHLLSVVAVGAAGAGRASGAAMADGVAESGGDAGMGGVVRVNGAAGTDGVAGNGALGAAGGEPVIDTERFGRVVGGDWGWWRTVTGNLDKLPALAADQPGLVPARPRFDPLAQARVLREVAETVPKGIKWRLRANVGDRVRWYELPEEVAH